MVFGIALSLVQPSLGQRDKGQCSNVVSKLPVSIQPLGGLGRSENACFRFVQLSGAPIDQPEDTFDQQLIGRVILLME